MSAFELKRRLFHFWPVRAIVAGFFFARGTAFFLVDPFRAITDFCWIYRVSGIGVFRAVAYRVVLRAIRNGRSGANGLVEAFLESPASERCRRRFLGPGGALDPAFRDILVVKPASRDEKGVLLLKYTAKFDLFVSLFDLDRVMADYYLVLEPCWSGYCDPSILMFVSPTCEVLVQSPERADFEFIERLGSNLVPVTLGASDWVDADLFAGANGGAPRPWDVVMVSHWGRRKNHRKLFRALEQVKRRPLSVLLIGYEWKSRTSSDIAREMSRYALDGITIELKERLPAAEVARHLAQSKVFVLLAEKEGSNKAVVEALFSNTPAIVYEGFIGGAVNKINQATGVLCSFDDLAASIDHMVANYATFTPRAWALAHTGSRNATAALDATLQRIAQARGERWTVGIAEKVNSPNMDYKTPDAVPVDRRTGSIAQAYLR